MLIEGVEVKFPYKRPYKSQMQIMSMVIKGLKQKQNCLLESPTGSGKTLALLCSALAWQENVKNDWNSNHTLDRIPRIYFGSRTHKQLEQVIKELKTTEYKDIKMTLLSSRDHSCVNKERLAPGCLKEGCKKLGQSCDYKPNVEKFKNFETLNTFGLSKVWDMEDLIKIGKEKNCCPYYVSRELVDDADIVFCPYNYLLDPRIRESMKLDLSNDIIILDEGHNIEDKCREAGSYTLVNDDLEETISDLEKYIKYYKYRMQDTQILCNKIKSWIETEKSNHKKDDDETEIKSLSGKDFLPILNDWGVNKEKIFKLKIVLQDEIKKEKKEDENVKGQYIQLIKKSDENSEKKENINNDKNSEEKENKNDKKKSEEKENKDSDESSEEEDKKICFLSTTSIALLEGIFYIIDILLTLEYRDLDDYKIVLLETKEYVTSKPNQIIGSVRRHPKKELKKVIKLNFWCLNAAVTFRNISNSRSVILTSGTLSPINSFQSELGVPFPIKLEASHVIPPSQVYVGCVGCGPNQVNLEAKYDNVCKEAFQDELGKVVWHVCAVAPRGVLCFFSSYSLMEKIVKQWKKTKEWELISGEKQIFVETSGNKKEDSAKKKEDFEQLISDYYSAVKQSGALLLAVYRGKISEGIDFSDDNARAVITVGIPYPNVSDKQVVYKKQYNDVNTGRGLLPGRKWYKIQAFRAINQALGRCIRHQNDWGALVIVDKRFIDKPKEYCTGLSKWIRNKVKLYNNFDTAMNSLEDFYKQMMPESSPESHNLDLDNFDTTMNSVEDFDNQMQPDMPKPPSVPLQTTTEALTVPPQTTTTTVQTTTTVANPIFSSKKKEKKTKVYKVCCHDLELEKCNLEFKLITEKFREKSAKLKACSQIPFVKNTAPLSESDDSLKLDSVFCQDEKIVYQFHSCCNEVIGFQVLNVENFSPEKLIVFAKDLKVV